MLVVAISALPVLIMLVYLYPTLLLCAFPFAELVNVFFGHYPVNIGGFDLVPSDPVIFFAVTYLVITVLRYPKRVMGVCKENIFLTVFLALVALYVVIYTPIYGQSAIGEARKTYSFLLFPILASLVIKTGEDLRRFFQVTILATAVVAIVTLGLAATQGNIIKVVGAEGAIMIALAAFAMLIHRFNRVVVFHPMVDRLLLCLFSALAIGLGHRTVWLAIGFGLMLVFWLYRVRRSLVIKSALVALWLLMAGGAALFYFPTVAAKLGAGFAGIISPSADSTASWRIEGWTDQLEGLQRSGRLLVGNGLGSYYRWQYGTNTVTVAPHNVYVQLMLKFGLVGLIIYALLALKFFRTSLTVRKTLDPGPTRAYIETGIVTFGAAHAYMSGYDFQLIMFIYFAVATSAAKLLQREARNSRRVSRIPARWFDQQGTPTPMDVHSPRYLDPQSSG